MARGIRSRAVLHRSAGPAMLVRFCLYGFLKNQRYFEPFLLLALLAKGEDYLSVGLLVSVRSLVVNIVEIPSGALADVYGRRAVMVLSFVAYFASFLVFAWASGFAALAGAMALYGVGEAFRTGSHKALIFRWLELNDRREEKVRIYGLTRSWSKLGSALSALVAAALVFASADYVSVFLWSLVPIGLSIVNLLGYPAEIDVRRPAGLGTGAVVGHMRSALGEVWRAGETRRCLIESMGFNGLFFAVKDYAQPMLVLLGAAWLSRLDGAAGWSEVQRTAVTTGPIYSLFFLGAAWASRTAHGFVERAGGERRAARRLWLLLAAAFALMATADFSSLPVVVLMGFAVSHVLQNWWRPIISGRLAGAVAEQRRATVLSLESQGHRLGTAVLAPVFGWVLDAGFGFWVVAVAGAVLAAGYAVTGNSDA